MAQDATPRPVDPRTPLQVAQARLQAARRLLAEGYPSRAQRQMLADRIIGLTETVNRLKQG